MLLSLAPVKTAREVVEVAEDLSGNCSLKGWLRKLGWNQMFRWFRVLSMLTGSSVPPFSLKCSTPRFSVIQRKENEGILQGFRDKYPREVRRNFNKSS
jgi:hypothetical protein